MKKKLSRFDFEKMKESGTMVTWVTAYDFPTASFVEQAGLEGAHEVVGRVARHAEIQHAHAVAGRPGELRGHRLLVLEPLAEHEGVAQEQVEIAARRAGRRGARAGRRLRHGTPGGAAPSLVDAREGEVCLRPGKR